MASVALMEYFKKTRRKQTESSELLESWDVMYDSLVSSDKKIEILVAENVDSVILNKVGKVRRAKLFYLRERSGKSARIKEKRIR